MEINEDSIPGPQGELTLKVLADHRSINPMGDVFAGWVALHLNQAGEIRAYRESFDSRVVTVDIGSMSFLRPVKQGDLMGFFTRVTETGRTSIKVVVEAWIEGLSGWEKLTETNMVFVALDGRGRTVQVRSKLGG